MHPHPIKDSNNRPRSAKPRICDRNRRGEMATVTSAVETTALKIERIRADIERHCGLRARMTGQACRRILNGEQVPTAE